MSVPFDAVNTFELSELRQEGASAEWHVPCPVHCPRLIRSRINGKGGELNGK